MLVPFSSWGTATGTPDDNKCVRLLRATPRTGHRRAGRSFNSQTRVGRHFKSQTASTPDATKNPSRQPRFSNQALLRSQLKADASPHTWVSAFEHIVSTAAHAIRGEHEAHAKGCSHSCRCSDNDRGLHRGRVRRAAITPTLEGSSHSSATRTSNLPTPRSDSTSPTAPTSTTATYPILLQTSGSGIRTSDCVDAQHVTRTTTGN